MRIDAGLHRKIGDSNAAVGFYKQCFILLVKERWEMASWRNIFKTDFRDIDRGFAVIPLRTTNEVVGFFLFQF